MDVEVLGTPLAGCPLLLRSRSYGEYVRRQIRGSRLNFHWIGQGLSRAFVLVLWRCIRQRSILAERVVPFIAASGEPAPFDDTIVGIRDYEELTSVVLHT